MSITLNNRDWFSPSDIVKKRVVTQAPQSKCDHNETQPDKSTPEPNYLNKKMTPSRKRCNPFAKESQIKAKLFCSSPKVEDEVSNRCSKLQERSDFLRSLDEVQAVNREEPNETLLSIEPRYNVHEATAPQLSQCHSLPVLTKEYSFFPLDWSLKSRVRFMSSQPFTFKKLANSGVESCALAAFTTQNKADSPEATFQSLLLLWMHPSLPWLNLFPRNNNNQSEGSSFLYNEESIQKALLDDWTCSLTSVYHCIQTGLCPYFYLCSHNFTVLFRWIDGDVIAILTPTTRGLREALKDEGVEFELLFDKDEVLQSAKEFDEPEPPVDRCSSNEAQETPVEPIPTDVDWLYNLGINKTKYKALDPARLMRQQELLYNVDGRSESAIYIRGLYTTALLNYLLNHRVQQSGILAGVPPTILAPRPFTGASLRTVMVRSGLVNQLHLNQSGSGGHYLELCGPILPSQVAKLCELLGTQDYSMHATVVENTTPFNAQLPGRRQCFDDAVLELCTKGLSGAVDVPLAATNSCRLAVRDLKCHNSMFSWY